LRGRRWTYSFLGSDQDIPEKPNFPRPCNGFRDGLKESGITFKMEFLPGEQGENFKIKPVRPRVRRRRRRLRRDGFDDVYFLNTARPQRAVP